MSLKAELEHWVAALEAFDSGDYLLALDGFSKIADSSKILFNMAAINATIGEHAVAVDLFRAATGLDQYLAIAYFQAGVSHYLLARFDLALHDFEDALLHLRSNQEINYEQIGLAFRLHAAEVRFNIGLSLLAMGDRRDGLAALAGATLAKAVKEHDLIDACMRDEGRNYTIFSVPAGVIFRPPAAKLKNIQAKDYLGKARLIAASDERDAFTTFTGVTRLKVGLSPTGTALKDDQIAAMRGDSLMVRSTSDPGLPPKSPIRQAMREEARRGIDAGDGTGALAASAMTRSKSSAAGVFRATDNAARRRGGLNPVPLQEADCETELYDDYYQSAPDLPPGLFSVHSVQAWAADAHDEIPPPGTSISRSTSGSTLPQVVTPAAISPASSTTSPSLSFRGQAPIRRIPSGPGARRAGQVLLKGHFRGGSAASENSQFVTSGSPVEYGDAFGDGDTHSGIADCANMAFEMTKVRLKIHYMNEIRGLSLTPEMSHADFVGRIAFKFGLCGVAVIKLNIRFQDEEGNLVSLVDEDDFEAAIDVARAQAQGRPEGKLDIWLDTKG